MSIFHEVCYTSIFHGVCYMSNFNEVCYMSIFRKSLENTHVSLKYNKNTGQFTRRPIYINDLVALNFS